MEKMYSRVDSCSLWASLHYIFPSEMDMSRKMTSRFGWYTDDALVDVCE